VANTKEYKKTGVGLIPEDWDVKELGEIVENGKISSGIFKEQSYYGVGTQIIKLGDVFSSDYFEPSLAQRLQINNKEKLDCKVDIGDIVIALASVKLDGVGKVMIVEKLEESTVYDHNVALIRASKNFDKKYLFYFLKSIAIREKVRKLSTQVGTTFLKSSSIRAFPISFPPTKAEQTAIDNDLSDTDALINGLEKLIVKKRNIKQGAMQKLFTPKEDWERKKLGEIAEIVGGGTPSSFIPNYWNGTINWFTPTEIGNNKYTFESVRKITKEGFINCSGKMLPIGTILLTTRAGIGDLSILMSEGCTNQGFQSLIAKEGYFNEYLYYLMQTLKNVLIQNASGSTFLEISPNKIKQIQISIPNFLEQTRIATILSDMDNEIEALGTKLKKYKVLRQGMMQNLLTGKIRLV